MMKKVALFLSILAIWTFLSCNGSSGSQEASNSESKSNEADKEYDENQEEILKSVVADYLSLKDQLVANDGKSAAEAGKHLQHSLEQLDGLAIAIDKNRFDDAMEDALEDAQHISVNAENIHHQREHFDFLSQDMNDFLEILGPPQKLYQIFCQAYKDGKGAYWISENEEIKNPYGSEFADCGKVEKQY